MKKALLLSISIVLVTAFNLNAQKKLAYVTDTTTANTPYVRDSLILPMFKADPNFVVTKIQATVAGQDLSGYDLILIAEAPSSASTIMATIKNIAKPILNMKTFVYKTATGCWNRTATANCVDNATALSVLVKHPGHPVLAGFNLVKDDSIKILTKTRQAVNAAATTAYKGLNGVTSFTSVASGAIDTIAVIKGAATGQISIFELPVGTVINGTTGSTVNGKYIHIGINGASWNNITADGLKVVKNAAYYLAGITAGLNSVSQSLPVTQTSKELIVNTTENLDLAIYSVSGQLVKRANGQSISINEMNKGIYILKMSNNKGLNQTYKFNK